MSLTSQEIKNLKDKKYRRNNGLFMVEGEKFCRDILNSDVEIVYTLTSNISLTGYPNIQLLTDRQITSLATTVTPQKIICICREKIYPIKSKGNSLILDRLQDPGNVGTLIRSAMAFGFNDIYLIDCADYYSEKVIRSSAGLSLKARLHNVTQADIISSKADIADKFIVADMFGESIDKIRLPKGRLSVIIGNEGQGVSADMMAVADIKVKIRMSPLVESLNAGVAGSIIMQKLSEV